MNNSFENAIIEAKRFVHNWEFFEGDDEIKNNAYHDLPEIVKDALEYLVDVGDID